MTFNVSVMMKSYKVKNRQIDKGCLHLQTLICLLYFVTKKQGG